MKTLKIRNNWSTTEAAVIHQFLGQLQEAIWQDYKSSLMTCYTEETQRETPSRPVTGQQQLDLNGEFDDELPF